MKITIQPAPVYKVTILSEGSPVRSFTASQVPTNPIKGDKGDPGPQGAIGPQGAAGPVGASSTMKRDVVTLNASHVSTKIVNLSANPISDWVLLMPDKGIPQRAGIDFFLDRNDNSIKWSGMGLDGVLRVSDRLEIHYFT